VTAKRFIRLTAIFLAACAGFAAFAARADTLQDVSRLIKQGRPAPALKQLEKYLSSRPNDVQGRFLKGVILVETNELNEAIVVFTKLTEEHPELPEPYNNLAVIYARQQQYDKAKRALEMAIQTHPAYATAHKNLEDVYARLASQAYDKALQTDSSKSSLPVKLATIQELGSTNSSPLLASANGKAPIELALAETKTGEPEYADAKLAASKQSVLPGNAGSEKPLDPRPTEAKPVEPTSTVPSSGRKSGETKPADAAPIETKASVEIPAKPGQATAAVGEITKAVTNWLSAWSDKDVGAYLAHYAKDFQTPGGEARAAWESERAKRIKKPGAIQVTYENLQIAVEAESATAKFRQHYKSKTLKTGTSKVLVLVHRDGRWLIQQERIGN
jgi:tetratricopeptide (TPR) repeat protein